MGGCTSIRPAGIYKTHDLMTYISRFANFRLFSMVKIFVIGTRSDR